MNNVQHEPYVPANKSIAEFTPKAVILGALFGLLFGATTVYLGLKVGLTVSASIPIAVLAISIFKKFAHSTILENNIVQTIGSAGESIAAGVVFTIPALLFLANGKDFFHYFQIFVLAFCGGILGILFMVPLRKALIVKEHGRLPYPEGTACADVLIAGEKGGDLAKKVYWGIGIAALYKFLMSILSLWKDVPEYLFGKKSVLPNGSVSAEITPELLGVGYIIGPQIAGTMVAGGILSSLVLIPLISYFGEYTTAVIPPATKLISDMSLSEIWSKYIRYIGAGAVTFSGMVVLLKTMPVIVQTFRSTVKDFRAKKNGEDQDVERTDRDLPLYVVILGSLGLVALMGFLPHMPVTLTSSLLVVIAGFFFVTVSSRIVGLIGSSSNPISGMTIATLMGTCLIFLAKGWTGDIYQPIALCVGSIVGIAAANAGAISQDLKTGYLVGATPIKQQVGMMIGVFASVIAIGFTLLLLNDAIGIGEATAEHPHPLPAPQATLMATVIKGMLDQSLPWGLVLVGMGIAAVVELCGINSLSFSVGAYLPLSTTMTIFIGGVIRALVNLRKKEHVVESELESGTLFSSGLIAGGALMGILIAIMLGTNAGVNAEGKSISWIDKFNLHLTAGMGWESDLIAVSCFALLCIILYFVAIRKEQS